MSKEKKHSIKEQKFTYRWFYRFIYRYGNVLATVILLLYIIPTLLNAQKDSTMYFYVVAIGVIIALINIYFVRLYKVVPYEIEFRSEKLICRDFLFSSKEVEIPFAEIDKLKGGIFDGKPNGVMRVYNSKKDIEIGFFHKISNAKVLESLILSKISKELYDEVLDKIGVRREKIREKANKN